MMPQECEQLVDENKNLIGSYYKGSKIHQLVIVADAPDHIFKLIKDALNNTSPYITYSVEFKVFAVFDIHGEIGSIGDFKYEPIEVVLKG